MLIIHVLSRPRRSFPPNSDKIVALVKASRRRMDLECARSPHETLYSLRTRLRANTALLLRFDQLISVILTHGFCASN